MKGEHYKYFFKKGALGLVRLKYGSTKGNVLMFVYFFLCQSSFDYQQASDLLYSPLQP